jgi:hypothetical protein
VDHLKAELVGEALRDQRAVTRERLALDAEQSGAGGGGDLGDEIIERCRVEDLGHVTLHVGGREALPRALAHTLPIVLAVLEVAQLGRRSQLAVVAIGDPRVGQDCLQPARVGPRELRTTDAAALAGSAASSWPR